MREHAKVNCGTFLSEVFKEVKCEKVVMMSHIMRGLDNDPVSGVFSLLFLSSL